MRREEQKKKTKISQKKKNGSTHVKAETAKILEDGLTRSEICKF
jgi:hypothetical protein